MKAHFADHRAQRFLAIASILHPMLYPLLVACIVAITATIVSYNPLSTMTSSNVSEETMFRLVPNPPGPSGTKLELPPTETRPHRHVVLSNGLEAVLVHDIECDKAAASMSVAVGHLEDPKNLPGCAHFCEHLMFLGTKKYPDENAYHAYLSANNGHSNAWTGMCETTYYFDVGPESLEGALDRFAGFFVDPLFAANCTEREIRAVDSEHSKNLQQDMWRFYQLDKHLCDPKHVYNRFGTGNFKTLWETPKSEGRDPRAELIAWWEKEYCARRMKLVVIGRDGLHELEAMVKSRFEQVPVRTKPGEERHEYSAKPFADSAGSFVFVKPVKDVRGMEISIPVPDQGPNYETKPASYLMHFLGHEGPGSVLSYLKRKGWVNELRAGNGEGGNGWDFFKLNVDLTEEGLAHYRDVALAIFSYMQLLKSTPPSQTAFEEIKAIAELGFRFAERTQASSYATDLSGWLQSPIPKEKTVSSQWLVERFDAKAIEDCLKLLDPRQAKIAITAKETPADVGELTDKEPIYGTEYKVIKMDEEFLQRASSSEVLPGLALPGPNAFIPENLAVEKIEGKTPVEEPSLIRDTALSRIWHKKDDRFWMPRANLFLSLRSPTLNVSPRNAVLARIYCDLFRDANTEEVYDAELAGLQFSLEYAGDSITLGTVGYNDKLPLLTRKMLELMKAFKADKDRFELTKDQLRRNWNNFHMEEPYSLASYFAHYADSAQMWTPREKLAELDHITSADIDSFAREFFGRVYIETLVHGNMKQEEALKLQDMVEGILAPRPLAAAEKIGERSLLLPPASQHVWRMPVPNTANTNNAIEYYCEVGELTDDQLRPRLALLSQLAHQPAFDTLRTKEQLGYIVFSGSRAGVSTMGFRIIVQSAKSASHLESRIEAFLDTFREYLEQMSEDDFAQHRRSLIAKKQEKPKNLHEESSRFWRTIGDGFYDFDRRQVDVSTLENVTKQDIIDLYMQHIHPSSATRRKFSIHLDSQVEGAKFDPTSAMPIIQKLMEKGIPVPEDQVQALMASSPSLAEIQGFAKQILGQVPLDDASKEELMGMVDGLGTTEDEAVPLKEGNVMVNDIIKWKAGLMLGSAATPRRELKVVA